MHAVLHAQGVQVEMKGTALQAHGHVRRDVCYIVYVMRVDTERDACTPVVVLLCVRWDDAADSYTML